MSKLSDYTGDYTLLQRDPVALPQWIKDGVIIAFSGLVVFDAVELNSEQMAWVLMFAGFLSAGVALWSRSHVWPVERVNNELIDAEAGLAQQPEVNVDELSDEFLMSSEDEA